jgi:hypothetical protein
MGQREEKGNGKGLERRREAEKRTKRGDDVPLSFTPAFRNVSWMTPLHQADVSIGGELCFPYSGCSFAQCLKATTSETFVSRRSA